MKVLLLSLLVMFMSSCGTDEDYQFKDGVKPARELKPCPETPNCVSSLARTEKHGIVGFSLEGTPEESISKLLKILNQLANVKIIESDERYVKAEFKTKLFGFVDDFEILATESIINVRSASRVGFYDFRANRKRVEKIRALYIERD